MFHWEVPVLLLISLHCHQFIVVFKPYYIDKNLTKGVIKPMLVITFLVSIMVHVLSILYFTTILECFMKVSCTFGTIFFLRTQFLLWIPTVHWPGTPPVLIQKYKYSTRIPIIPFLLLL